MKAKPDEQQTKALLPREIATYKLATLAARICPEACQQDPELAIELAQRLMLQAQVAIVAKLPMQLKMLEPVGYNEGVKTITKQKRLDRAQGKLLEAWSKLYGAPAARRKIAAHKKNGFTRGEILSHRLNYEEVVSRLPAPKKGKQGRRLSDHDQRMKVEGIPIASPPAPSDPLEREGLTARDKHNLHEAAVRHDYVQNLDEDGENFAKRKPLRGEKGDVGFTTGEAVANRRAAERSKREKSNKNSSV